MLGAALQLEISPDTLVYVSDDFSKGPPSSFTNSSWGLTVKSEFLNDLTSYTSHSKKRKSTRSLLNFFFIKSPSVCS